MTKTAIRSQWGGRHRLPPLTEEEEAAYERKQYHRVRQSDHVQAMEALINESLSVSPSEVDGVVIYFDPEEQEAPFPGYALVKEDEEGDIVVYQVSFVGSALTDPGRLLGLTKEQLVKERFEHTPPRSLLR